MAELLPARMWHRSRARAHASFGPLAVRALELLALAGAGAGLAGCAEDAGEVRLLDRICQLALYDSSGSATIAPCAVEGDAKLTSGVTSDSLGFVLGPRYGMLRIRLRAIDQLGYTLYAGGMGGLLHAQSWSLEALMASAREEGSIVTRTLRWGSCAGCPDDPVDFAADLPEDYNWVPAIESLPGVSSSYEATIPDDAWLIFSGADVQIADIRLPGIDATPYDSYY